MPEAPAPQPPAQRTTSENQPPGRREEPTEGAVLLARAEQRLAQERLVMQARLDRERGLRRIQVAMGWLIVVMLPSVAVVCVIVMFRYESVPPSVLASASGAFFVDIVGLVVAGWRTLLVWNLPDDPLTPVTLAPELHQQIDLEAAGISVVTVAEAPPTPTTTSPGAGARRPGDPPSRSREQRWNWPGRRPR